MPNEQNWTDFKQLWATAFPPLTERDGIKWWEKFVLTSNWHTMEEAFEILARQYRTKKAAGLNVFVPRLADFKDLYWSITNRTRSNYAPLPDCSACENSGSVIVVRHEVEKDVWRICDIREPFPVDSHTSLATFAFPCFCRHASRRLSELDAMTVRENNFGAPGASRAAAQEYIDECRRLYMESVVVPTPMSEAEDVPQDELDRLAEEQCVQPMQDPSVLCGCIGWGDVASE